MTELHELIAKLEKLDAKSTPAPWVIESHPAIGLRVTAEVVKEKHPRHLNFFDFGFLMRNAKFIVLLRNSLPTILKALKEREKMAAVVDAARGLDKLIWDKRHAAMHITDLELRALDVHAALHAIEEQVAVCIHSLQ